MGSALVYAGCLAAGLVVPRRWLLPLPLVVLLVVDTISPVGQADDFSGIGRLVSCIVATLVLACGVAAGKVARRRGWFSN
jgi:hypothetical protein